MFRPMKPETIARRAKARAEAAIERKRNLVARLQEKVAEEGPESIWAEMLAEHR
jgi:hypothetical protein